MLVHDYMCEWQEPPFHTLSSLLFHTKFVIRAQWTRKWMFMFLPKYGHVFVVLCASRNKDRKPSLPNVQLSLWAAHASYRRSIVTWPAASDWTCLFPSMPLPHVHSIHRVGLVMGYYGHRQRRPSPSFFLPRTQSYQRFCLLSLELVRIQLCTLQLLPWTLLS